MEDGVKHLIEKNKFLQESIKFEDVLKTYDHKATNSKILAVPTLDQFYIKPLKFEGFSYENWRNDELLPRKMNSQEHEIFMKLIEQVATLIGKSNIYFDD